MENKEKEEGGMGDYEIRLFKKHVIHIFANQVSLMSLVNTIYKH